jgi:hypothetical protein
MKAVGRILLVLATLFVMGYSWNKENTEVQALENEFRVIEDEANNLSNPENRITIVITGDGYTKEEEAKFLADARTSLYGDPSKGVQGMFATSPFDRYRPFFRIVYLPLYSNESGVDYPPYVEGCTSDNCCAYNFDPYPKSGQMVETILEAACCRGTMGQLHISAERYVSFLIPLLNSEVPGWNVVAVIVNDDDIEAGSAGGILITTSPHSRVLSHEMGHLVGLLEDEHKKWTKTCSDLPGATLRPCGPNLTELPDEKWGYRYGDGRTSPTLVWDEEYGLYRPEPESIMYNGVYEYFNAISIEGIVRAIYEGNPYELIEGISLIDRRSPSASLVPAGNVLLEVTLLEPVGGDLDIRWYKNDQLIAEAVTSLVLSLSAGDRVTFEVTDTGGGLIHPNYPFRDVLTQRATWTVGSSIYLPIVMRAY